MDSPYTPEELERVVAESRAAQGLPRYLEDPATVELIAGLILAKPIPAPPGEEGQAA